MLIMLRGIIMSIVHQYFPKTVVDELEEHDVELLNAYLECYDGERTADLVSRITLKLADGKAASDVVTMLRDDIIYPLVASSIKETTRERIDDGWWTTMCVMGSEAEDTPSFTYTIGLGVLCGYEVTLSGINNQTAGEMANQIGEYFRDNPNRDIENFDCSFGTLRDGTPLRYRIEQRPLQTAIDEYAHQTDTVYPGAEEMTMLIVVLPDENNLLPGEEGYDETFRQLTNETLEGVYRGQL